MTDEGADIVAVASFMVALVDCDEEAGFEL